MVVDGLVSIIFIQHIGLKTKRKTLKLYCVLASYNDADARAVCNS